MSSPEKFKDWQQSQADIAQREYERRFFAYMNTMGDDIKARLNGLDDLESLNRFEIERLIQDLEAIQDRQYDKARADLIQALLFLAGYIALTEGQGLDIEPAAEDEIKEPLLTMPIAASGMLLLMHINNLVSYNKKRVDNTVRFAWANKMTIKELKARVVGTALKAYRDGVLGDNKLKARAMIDAAIQHSINTATIETWKRNDIKYYVLIAEIDSRTTDYCRSINNKVQKVGEGLVPPFHYNCRTKMVDIADDGFRESRSVTLKLSDYAPTSSNVTYNSYKKMSNE